MQKGWATSCFLPLLGVLWGASTSQVFALGSTGFLPFAPRPTLSRSVEVPMRPTPESPPRSPAVPKLGIQVDQEGNAALSWEALREGSVPLGKIPLRWLLPRLEYTPAQPPDAFDGFNLMLTEFSRTGLKFPLPSKQGAAQEIHVANNCLSSGLWEVSLRDPRQNELTHGWGEVPRAEYLSWIEAETGLSEEFLETHLVWSEDPVSPAMERLREVTHDLGVVQSKLVSDFAFSPETPESKRKFLAGYCSTEPGTKRHPSSLKDLSKPLYFRDFVPPGTYGEKPDRKFDLSFLLEPKTARVLRVRPLTQTAELGPPWQDESYTEVTLALGSKRLCIGNIPLKLLRKGRSYRLHGFGVGIPEAIAALPRRKRRETLGLAPAYAYLMEAPEEGGRVLNNHAYGLETVDLRVYRSPKGAELEITLGSFERVIEMTRYRIPIPDPLAWTL